MPITCRACGVVAPDDSRFCPTCGTNFAPPPPRAPAGPSAPPSATGTAGFQVGSPPFPQQQPTPSPWPGSAPPPPPQQPHPWTQQAPPYGYGAPPGQNYPYGYPAPPAPTFPPGSAASRPLGVTIMSVWNIGFGAVATFGSLGLMLLGPSLVDDPQFRQQLLEQGGGQIGPGLLAGALVGFGAFLFLLSLSMVAVGYGLFHGRSWAWQGMIAVTAMWLILGVLTIPGGLLTVAIAGFLLWYFFQPGVKRWFGRMPPDAWVMPGYIPPPPPPPSAPPPPPSRPGW